MKKLFWNEVRAEEGEVVVGLTREFYAEEKVVFEEEWVRRGVGELMREGSEWGRVFLLRDEEGGVWGYVVVTVCFSLEWGGRFGLLDELFVRKEVRGGGWGREALRVAEEWARGAGMEVLRLEVNAHNERAKGIYLRAGFVDERRGILGKEVGKSKK